VGAGDWACHFALLRAGDSKPGKGLDGM